MDEVTAVLEEAIRETIGTSSKKWAVVVVALVAGALRRVLADPPSPVR